MSAPSTSARPVASARRRPHVVILGGGFAGLGAAKALRSSDVDVTLVDQRTYNTFQPLLYQVATAGLNAGDVTFFLRAARMRQLNLSFRHGEAESIDSENQIVNFTDGGSIDYDYLIVATGVTTNYFGTPGAEEHTLAIYSRQQALTLRDRIFTQLEHAAASNDGKNAPELTMVVVGAGATGVETAGALAEMRNDAMSVVYPELDPRRTHIVLIEMGKSVLPPFKEHLRDYAEKELRERGVELRLETSVKEVSADGVTLGTGEFLPAKVVVWATGVTAPKIVSSWGLPQGRGGRITVESDLRVTGFENIFATGDIAIGPEALPQLAQPALQEGVRAGKNIAALITGRPTEAFKYKDKGTMATVGRRAAIADIALPFGKSIQLTGTLAWLVWLYVHIATLLGNRNRLATFVNLVTKYMAPSRRTNPIVGDVPVFDRVSVAPAAKAKQEKTVVPAPVKVSAGK
ncbi:NAD(P)/FAD-dependent oxidoreductase [Nakamurella antarctica]|uniref:NADH:ubiquinone reductase (non-electrogenic) n=1 Tax=Nakamurella antarctica TaxID=1902245 RepID=A0A3G8ZMK9_9ACTN|nr:NAD(P)/FAD-dependent oxidoreductase [Nakamurella antarctica]AZI58025.1 NAD(P)/FAD-dependent oxidoreductase [Nakamurella antarctica]